MLTMGQQVNREFLAEVEECCGAAAEAFHEIGDLESFAEARFTGGNALISLATGWGDVDHAHRAGRWLWDAMVTFGKLGDAYREKLAGSARSAAFAFGLFGMMASDRAAGLEALSVAARTYEEAAQHSEALCQTQEACFARVHRAFVLCRTFQETRNHALLDPAEDLLRRAIDVARASGLEEVEQEAKHNLAFIDWEKRLHACSLRASAARTDVEHADEHARNQDRTSEAAVLRAALAKIGPNLLEYRKLGALHELGQSCEEASRLLQRVAVLEENSAPMKEAVEVASRGAMAFIVAEDSEASERASELARAAMDALMAWPKVDSAGQTVRRSTSDATTAGEGAIPDEAAPSSTLELGDTFAEASLGELVETLVPSVPQAAIDRLEAVIREAQETPPGDKESFVRDVNRILDAQKLRLQVEGREGLGRLTVKEGLVRLSVSGQGQQSFRGKCLKVVPVPDGYAVRGVRSEGLTP